ncbi:DUF1822 family protein [Laspinema olomoucense]|uniref:DUF1822 family protein n=1 Tax=Laspinema olomoucense TaxID=3231600 RepID=UPI0021BB5C75|nr:DUF1822 family protein [Laspinema sp. D3a]MCT7991725.1 DUF1822 family protein [Laspinema sp. D3a]
MGTTIQTSSKDRLEKAWQALQAAQDLQEDRLRFGLDHVNLYVEDVEGDWIETWGEGQQWQNPVNLGKWFQERFEPGWQAIDEVFCPKKDSLALIRETAGVKRAKTLQLGHETSKQRPIALIVTIKAESHGETGVLVQVYPTGDRPELPAGLQLTLLSHHGDRLHEVVARNADSGLQMELSGQPGERYTLQVTLEREQVTEEFVI